MKIFKTTFLILLLLFCFSGCFNKSEIEDLAYAIAVGVDKGTENNIIVTYQIAVPIKIAGEGSTGGKSATSLVTLETDSLYNSISRANTMISKEITLSHNKLIVISEELAKEGIHDLLNAFVTNREVRPKTSVIIYKGQAKEMLESLEPILEKNPARYYDLLLDTNEYTGYAIDNNLFNFYLGSQDILSSPYALITEPVRESESSIEIPSKSKLNPDSTPELTTTSTKSENSQNKQQEENTLSGDKQNSQSKNIINSGDSQNNNLQNNNSQNNQLEIKNSTGSSQNKQTTNKEPTGESEGENSEKSNSSEETKSTPHTANIAGIAIFSNDKLVGEIKNEQIISHLLLLGKLRKVNIDIEDIEDNSKTTVVKLSQRENPKIDVSINKNIPKINILIRLECDLITSGSDIDYTDKENKHKLSQKVKEKLLEDMKIYLRKVCKEYETDPVGFGKYYRTKVLTISDLENIEWDKIFPNSEFNIEFQLHLDTTQMVSNQIS